MKETQEMAEAERDRTVSALSHFDDNYASYLRSSRKRIARWLEEEQFSTIRDYLSILRDCKTDLWTGKYKNVAPHHLAPIEISDTGSIYVLYSFLLFDGYEQISAYLEGRSEHDPELVQARARAEELEQELKSRDNQLSVAHGTVKSLKTKALTHKPVRPSRMELIDLMNSTRKLNGKPNMRAMARDLHKDPKTVKRWCQEARIAIE